jgi:hypothetical protein
MSVDVSVILNGLETGSIPVQSGISALLLKSRDSPAEVVSAIDYILQLLETSQDFGAVSTSLELLSELLGEC